MRKKIMMLTTIFTFAICLCCLGFGVYAAINQTFITNHTIGFVADDNVFVAIKGQIINAEQTNLTQAPSGYESLEQYFKAKNFVYNQEFNEEDRKTGNQYISNWIVGENLKFANNDDGITFEITIYNYSDRAISVEITNYVVNNDNIENTTNTNPPIVIGAYNGEQAKSKVITLNTKAKTNEKFDAKNDFTVTIKSIIN